jgi:hypothetical protein
LLIVLEEKVEFSQPPSINILKGTRLLVVIHPTGQGRETTSGDHGELLVIEVVLLIKPEWMNPLELAIDVEPKERSLHIP